MFSVDKLGAKELDVDELGVGELGNHRLVSGRIKYFSAYYL